jgi:hypothetical protein
LHWVASAISFQYGIGGRGRQCKASAAPELDAVRRLKTMKSKAKRRQPDMRELGEASLKASERENPQLFSRAKRLSLLSLVIFIVVLVYTFYEVKFNGEVVRKNLQVAPLLPIALLFCLPFHLP